MFDFFKKTEKLPRGVKKTLQPRKEFAERTKAAFLAVYDARFAERDRTPARRTGHGLTAVRAFIAAGSLIAAFAAMSVYADTANVGADNPLYPLKRLGESVQLVIAPQREKIQLQATFAMRRADEINDLQSKNPTSTAISKLADDLDDDIKTSVADAGNADLTDGPLTAYCNNLISTMANSPMAVRDVLHLRGDLVAKFENQCAGTLASSGAHAAHGSDLVPGGGTASSSPSSTLSISASSSAASSMGSGNTISSSSQLSHFPPQQVVPTSTSLWWHRGWRERGRGLESSTSMENASHSQFSPDILDTDLENAIDASSSLPAAWRRFFGI